VAGAGKKQCCFCLERSGLFGKKFWANRDFTVEPWLQWLQFHGSTVISRFNRGITDGVVF
jgi:hypothetical protein